MDETESSIFSREPGDNSQPDDSTRKQRKRAKDPVQADSETAGQAVSPPQISSMSLILENEDLTEANSLPLEEEETARPQDESKWTRQELETLLENLVSHIPKGDTMPFAKRAEQVDWANVAVQGKSATQGRLQWNNILSRVRRFRLMLEVLEDARSILQSIPDSPVQAPAVSPRFKPKHPDFPKRPCNAFLQYRRQKFQHLKAKHPKWSGTELSQRLGEKFRELSDEEKDQFTKLLEEDQRRYQLAKKQFFIDHPDYAGDDAKIQSNCDIQFLETNGHRLDTENRVLDDRAKRPTKPRPTKRPAVRSLSRTSGGVSVVQETDDDPRVRSPTISAIKGKQLFIYENDRDFRCSFPKLSDGQVRDRLGQMFDDMSDEQQTEFEERAAHFESVFR